MTDLYLQLQHELQQEGKPELQHSAQKFFKEKITAYGIKSADVKKTAQKYEKLMKGQDKIKIFSLCERLWQSGYIEESFVACHLSYKQHKNFEQSDMHIFEKWIENYVTNWASCDTFCNHTVGALIEMFPDQLATLKTWTHSPNRWMKRAAAVSLIIPAREGLFLEDIFEIADALLLDTDDLVQKGYGWMLKSASEAHQDQVFAYIMKHKDKMPRTALRYAIEKMPPERKRQAMEKNKTKN